MTRLVPPSVFRLIALLALATGLQGQAPEPGQAMDPKPKAAAVKRKGSSPRAKRPVPPKEKRLDLNSASKDELKTLPGVTDELAQRIIQNRPYLSKGFLVTKKVMPVGTYQGLSARVMAVQKGVKTR